MKTPHTRKRYRAAVNVVYALCLFLVLLNVLTCYLVIAMYRKGIGP